MDRALRVLDVGLGRGAQARRLARAGHEVTGYTSDPDLLALAEEVLAEEPQDLRKRVRLVPGDSRNTGAHFAPGSFDVVLCHHDLMEAHDPGNTLAGLARVLGRGGLLSVVVRNDDALAMHPGRTGDWDAALAALDYPERAGRPFRREALATTMAGIGVPLREWYGVQVFGSEQLDPRTGEPDEGMLAAEERAARTDPYRSVAAMLHLCGLRG